MQPKVWNPMPLASASYNFHLGMDNKQTANSHIVLGHRLSETLGEHISQINVHVLAFLILIASIFSKTKNYMGLIFF